MEPIAPLLLWYKTMFIARNRDLLLKVIGKIRYSPIIIRNNRKHKGQIWRHSWNLYIISTQIDDSEADFFAREWSASKIKQIQAKYWKSWDTGRQSGGGKIVATFYDLCSKIGSGSPATETIQLV